MEQLLGILVVKEELAKRDSQVGREVHGEDKGIVPDIQVARVEQELMDLTVAPDSQTLLVVQMKDKMVVQDKPGFEELMDMGVVLDNLVVLVAQKMEDTKVHWDNQVFAEEGKSMDMVVVLGNWAVLVVPRVKDMAVVQDIRAVGEEQEGKVVVQDS